MDHRIRVSIAIRKPGNVSPYKSFNLVIIIGRSMILGATSGKSPRRREIACTPEVRGRVQGHWLPERDKPPLVTTFDAKLQEKQSLTAVSLLANFTNGVLRKIGSEIRILRRNNRVKIGNARLFTSELEIHSGECNDIFLFVILTLRQSSKGKRRFTWQHDNTTRSLKAMSYWG